MALLLVHETFNTFNWTCPIVSLFLCPVCHKLLKATSSGFCLPQTTFLHPLCGSLRRSGRKRLPAPGSFNFFYVGPVLSYNWTDDLSSFRTLETPSAVFSEGSSPSERRSPAVDFPLRQRASTCSNCPTTAKRASCATNCATLLAWTPALSSPNSTAAGRTTQRSCVMVPEPNKGRVVLSWCGFCLIRVPSSQWRWRGRSPQGHTDSPFGLYMEVCDFRPLDGINGNAVSAAQSSSRSPPLSFLQLSDIRTNCGWISVSSGSTEKLADVTLQFKVTWKAIQMRCKPLHKRGSLNRVKPSDALLTHLGCWTASAERIQAGVGLVLKCFVLDLMHPWEVEDKSKCCVQSPRKSGDPVFYYVRPNYGKEIVLTYDPCAEESAVIQERHNTLSSLWLV